MTQAMARSTAAGRRGPDPQGSRSRSLTEGCHVVSQAMLGPHGRQSGPAPRPVSASRVLDPRESKFGTWPTCRPARPRPPAGSRPARRPQRRWLLAVALPQPPAHPDTDHVRERQDPSVTPAVPYGLLLAWAVHDLEEVLTFERWKRTAVPRLRARFPRVPGLVWQRLEATSPQDSEPLDVPASGCRPGAQPLTASLHLTGFTFPGGCPQEVTPGAASDMPTGGSR